MRLTARIIVIVGLVAALGGCSSPDSANSFDLAEWAIDGPTELSADTESVDVANAGSLPHTLVVTDSSGQVVAATDLIPPGESVALDLDLDEGRYSFTCRIVAQSPEGELVDHYEAGMNTTISVTG